MQFFWIVSLVAALAVAVFAVQNGTPVQVKFLFREVRTSVPVLVFVSAAAGAAIAFFLGLPRQVRSWKELRNIRAERKSLKAEQELMQHRITELTSKPKETIPETRESTENS